jgi:glucoamylase
VQLDEVAFPVLLAGTLADRGALDGIEVGDMVRRALGFIVRHGPASPQDRWEENSGVNAFTMAVCLAALVSGAGFLPAAAEGFVLELADYWNARLDDWTSVTGSALDQRYGVRGHYLRIAPPEALHDVAALARVQPIKNREQDPGLPAQEQIGGDFLQLVRYGLRDPDLPLMRDSVTLLDRLLRVELPQGPCWYRYTGDGYGEYADGRPYDGAGLGHPWPLLTGERGHYELARGEDALPYLRAMAAMADGAGMLPEQVWERDPLPERGLCRGGPTGSAMPLAWAHAEFVKLACSILRGHPVDRPEPLWARYHKAPPAAQVWFWSPQAPVRRLPAGHALALVLPAPARVAWRFDAGGSGELDTTDPGLGVHVARLPPLPADCRTVSFELLGQQGGPQRVDVLP